VVFNWENMEEEIDVTKLKYVLYARKSTDDPEKQGRSVEDQIAECEVFALKNHLRIVGKPIIEKRSAKKPDQRPLFTQMLRDIKAGKYDAILAWHPDRLARNMKEGGEIINMIDEGEIKDLKFITHYFTNDANGKMILGLAFVLSKQYSDKLSQDITRGVRGNLVEGKTATPKYGYINEDGFYSPDKKNHELICKAWEMRTKGESIEKINDYLNKQGFYRLIKRSGEKQKITMQKLSRMFQDPFYYGVLIQAKQNVDLREIYNFVRAVSKEDYDIVQSLTYRKMKPHKPHKENFYPFKMMIRCAYCGSNMRVAPSTGKTSKYLYARCDNAKCKRNLSETKEKNKELSKEKQIRASIRTKVVLDFIYDFLKGGLGLTEEDYQRSLEAITAINEERRKELKAELHSKKGATKITERELTQRALGEYKLKPKSYSWQAHQKRMVELEQEKLSLEKQIKKLEELLDKPEQEQLSLEQFLNLSKNALLIVKSGSAMAKDKICRLIFTNFFVDNEKVTKYSLNEPFATLLKGHNFLLSGDGGNRTLVRKMNSKSSTSFVDFS